MKSLHPFVAVPLIALIDALVLATIAAAQASLHPASLLSPGTAALFAFAYGGTIAIAVGILLAWPFRKLGSRVPQPRPLWFTAIGVAAALALALIFDGLRDVVFASLLLGTGGLSGFLWWLMVERNRSDWDLDFD